MFAGTAIQTIALAESLGVKSVLVMRSEPDSMVVAATAGEAIKHYTVGGAGTKALDDGGRIPLYCERVVDTDAALFVRDSRDDATFAGNVVGTVCVLDDSERDCTDAQLAELEALRGEVEKISSPKTVRRWSEAVSGAVDGRFPALG